MTRQQRLVRVLESKSVSSASDLPNHRYLPYNLFHIEVYLWEMSDVLTTSWDLPTVLRWQIEYIWWSTRGRKWRSKEHLCTIAMKNVQTSPFPFFLNNAYHNLLQVTTCQSSWLCFDFQIGGNALFPVSLHLTLFILTTSWKVASQW